MSPTKLHSQREQASASKSSPVAAERRTSTPSASNPSLDTELMHIIGSVPSAKSMCLMRFGGGGELDLAELSLRFRETVLLEHDAPAAMRCIERARPTHGAIRLIAPMDLSGVMRRLGKLQLRFDEKELRILLRNARAELIQSIPRVDLVVSDCWLPAATQSIGDTLGNVPWVPRVRAEIAASHLQLSMALAPGGSVVCVTRCATGSSGAFSHLLRAEAPLLELFRWTRSRRLSADADPFVLDGMAREAPGALGREHRLLRPWARTRRDGQQDLLAGISIQPLRNA